MIRMAPDGDMGHRCQHRSQLQQAQEPRHGVQQQLVLNISMVLMAIQATQISMTVVAAYTDPGCGRTMDTHVALINSFVLDDTMAQIRQILCQSTLLNVLTERRL